jgi:hypothetical protein
MRATLSRLERDGVQRREAKLCATEGHPPARILWAIGDYATPDQRVCGRCCLTLEVRWPSQRKADG